MLSYEDKLRLQLQQEELTNRESTQEVDILSECLPYQLEFINDPAKRKFICSTRRSGKSFTAAIDLINTALKTPKGKLGYFAISNESAKRTMWSDIFETIILKYNLGLELTSKLEIKFPNGAIIYLGGLDSTPKQMAKLRGQKYVLFYIDEAQDFQQDLNMIINSVLKMALAQAAATLGVLGTPGDDQGEHYWWLMNKPDTKETQWKKFFFDWRNNTKIDPQSNRPINEIIQEELDKDIERTEGRCKLLPDWQKEIDGLWVISTSARIYMYENVNSTNTMFENKFFDKAKYLLSLDFGHSPDPNALCIMAYNTYYDSKLRVIKSFQKGEISTQALANEIKLLDKIYHFTYMVCDAGGQGKQLAFDLNDTYGLNIESAEKYGKLAHINMMNSDFVTRDIIIYEPENKELISQLSKCIWDRKALLKGERVEDKKFHNHLTDALLYGHFFSHHHWYRVPKPKETPEEHFMSAILKGEQQVRRTDFINQDKQRLNPYARKAGYR